MEEIWALKESEGIINLFLGEPHKDENNVYSGVFVASVAITEDNKHFYKSLNLNVNEPKQISFTLEDKKMKKIELWAVPTPGGAFRDLYKDKPTFNKDKGLFIGNYAGYICLHDKEFEEIKKTKKITITIED